MNFKKLPNLQLRLQICDHAPQTNKSHMEAVGGEATKIAVEELGEGSGGGGGEGGDNGCRSSDGGGS